ncbi:probable 2-oxoglutarate-dependent dioxygenase AOP1 [Vigna radiata var. radiata]|uniref:Probable 2-oxoglutarate-dependent dioxygenase AOP1 n=1 Tax=Vigna radiata var. radiata TaxID=3916 RepID=A0A1S3VAJ3_VIGRR|nr:probable 2-oxoglutarate-dependent dioxygenase AOP1 [Vigna radiata var. radiata]
MMISQNICQVPVVDFTDKEMKPGTTKWVSACKVIRNALEDHGCFYALYDKVPIELYNSVFTLMEEQFDLPLETKMQKISDKPYHGYYGQNAHVPLYESLGINDPLSTEEIQKFTKLMWPAGYDHFCETMSLYAKLVVELDHMSKRMVFDGYGVDQKHCDSLLESTKYMLRSFKYRVPQKHENNLGLHPHTDTSFFTILHQNNVNGLQVKLKNGDWIHIDPSPFMFLILAGDAFKVWSNDRMQCCEHRVIISGEKERYSMGLFSLGGKVVETQEELVDEEHPRQYKPFDHYEYLRFYATKKALESKSRIKAFCGIDYADEN